MKCFSYAFLLVGICFLSTVTVQGYSVRNVTEEVAVKSDLTKIGSSESSSEEPALVQFIGNNDNTTTDKPSDVKPQSIGGFFKKLGADLVRGTEIVRKSVSETKAWSSVKNGFERLKNLFSRNKEVVEEKEAVKDLKPLINMGVNTTEPIVTSTETPLDNDNEIDGDDPAPEIDVRILGGSGAATGLEPVVYKFD